MSFEFLALRNLIHPLSACLNGVIDLSNRTVLDELQYMDDERMKYLHPKSSEYKGLHSIANMIRYTSDLFHLCECLFMTSRIDKFSNKPIHSLVLDAVDESTGVIVTDSLVVEFVYRVDEMCHEFIKVLDERFNLSVFMERKKLVSIDDTDISSRECEMFLSSVKHVIGLINKAIEPTEKVELFNYNQFMHNMDSFKHLVTKRLPVHLSMFRVIGCWLCSIGLSKKENVSADTVRTIASNLASALVIVKDGKETESKSNGLLSALCQGITVDMYIQFSDLQMMYNEPEMAYKYLLRAKSNGWNPESDSKKRLKLCTEALNNKLPTDTDVMDKKPSADGTLLKKGKPPLQTVQFKLLY